VGEGGLKRSKVGEVGGNRAHGAMFALLLCILITQFVHPSITFPVK
jgi:hypothetical protein